MAPPPRDPRMPQAAGAVDERETDRMAIARFALVALDCPDPRALADFYAAITGWEVTQPYDSDNWLELRSDNTRASRPLHRTERRSVPRGHGTRRASLWDPTTD